MGLGDLENLLVAAFHHRHRFLIAETLGRVQSLGRIDARPAQLRGAR